MAAIEPLVSPDPAPIVPFPDRPSRVRRSRVRPILAALMLIVLGVFAAASVFASRSYRHAPTPAPTTPARYQNAIIGHPTTADPC